MLTRLRVKGFKNLGDVDVRFGPFTCVAGPNGVGKSNLFDAVAFLATLADRPLMEAALAVRGGEARGGDVRGLFQRTGGNTADRLRFLVEMLVPEDGEDALGQPAKASTTFLRYELELRYRPHATIESMGTLEITHESMVHINQSAARATLGFPHKKAWRDSVVVGRRTSPYISTKKETGVCVVSLHADSVGGRGGGRPRRVPAASLPRTMLSSVNNAAEHRTLVLARQEMTGWTQLQLEPSALRAPDSFTAPRSVSPNGAHLPATLYELTQAAERRAPGGAEDVCAQVANTLARLVHDISSITVDVDEKRQLLNIAVTDAQGTEHLAGALSDGTLRFLALTVMEADPGNRRLLCLEEPENGMHPLRIPQVIDLLGELAVDVEMPVDEDNPLRQVVANTHSPAVVACVHDDALLVAVTDPIYRDGVPESRFALRHLPGTWRQRVQPDVLPACRGDLLAYLDPLTSIEAAQRGRPKVGATRRVIDRKDLQMPLPLEPEASGAQ